MHSTRPHINQAMPYQIAKANHTKAHIAQEPLCVIIAADEHYLKYASVVIASIMAHTQSEVVVYILSDYISEANRAKLSALESRFAHKAIKPKSSRGLGLHQRLHIEILEISQAHFALLPAQGEQSNHIAYLRLMLEDVLPKHIDKCLYLDCDTLVCADIAELFSLDMKGALLAGVRDLAYTDGSSHIGNHFGFYFNSGVLLIDMKQWRESAASELVSRALRDCPDLARGLHDQNILNHCFGTRTYELGFEWNAIWNPDTLLYFEDSSTLENNHNLAMQNTGHCATSTKANDLLLSLQKAAQERTIEGNKKVLSRHSREAYLRALSAPKIIHFASSLKPWLHYAYILEKPDKLVFVDYQNPYTKLWWRVAKTSVFYSDIYAVYKPHLRAYRKSKMVYFFKRTFPRIYALAKLALKHKPTPQAKMQADEKGV